MSLLEDLRARLQEMVDSLSELVAAESPSDDLDAVAGCADEVARLGRALLGVAPESVVVDGHPHLLWRFGARTQVVLIGHMDTVWPRGTIDAWPFSTENGIARGPGSFDMKSGIVQGLEAVRALADRDGVALLVTSDEEIGSPTSTALIEETATGARAALVLEPSAGGALKIARKGVSMYEIEILGREAHAGLEPKRGVNALMELAHQLPALARIAGSSGTTVTPTVAHAGTAVNVVPARAVVHVDVRVPTPEEQRRVDDEIRGLRPRLEDAQIVVRGGPNRAPMSEASSADLFARAQRLAMEMGMGELAGTAVGGGSDGNFTAGMGVPTLDGLGAVGDGAHSRREHLILSSMPERAALVAALIDDIRTG